MSYSNTVIVGTIGNIGELRQTPNSKVVQVSIATDDRRKDATDPIWHRVNFWGKSAETVAAHFQKGSGIMVECDMRDSAFTKKDGGKAETVELVARRWSFLNPSRVEEKQPDANASGGAPPDDLADVPF